MDADTLRAQYPVLAETAYLNAGTCGPLPQATVDAMRAEIDFAASAGRGGMPYFERIFELQARLRQGYARVVGAADPNEVALTTSTSEGMVRILTGLDLEPGDEILIAELEHPGLLGPLSAARSRLGVVVREVPLAAVAESVTADTKLVACSHVSWTAGELAPSFADVGNEVPVLLDGAQGAGAIAFEAGALGCAFYAAAGQKWLCGPIGTGLLWVSPEWRERLGAAGPTYLNLETPAAGLDATPWPDARAFDSPALAPESTAGAIASLDALEAFGWDAVHARALALADTLADRLRAAGRTVVPRGATTLVSWESEDPEAEVVRAGEAGVVIRDFHGEPKYVRASVGAWNDEADLDRLLAVASA